MAKLPVISGREAVQVFVTLGWAVARQRGSHIVLVKEGESASLSVPDHEEVAKGTLRSLIRLAGITVDEFLDGQDKLHVAVTDDNVIRLNRDALRPRPLVVQLHYWPKEEKKVDKKK